MKRFFLLGIVMGVALLILIGCNGDQTGAIPTTIPQKAHTTPGVGQVTTAGTTVPRQTPTAMPTPFPLADSTIVKQFYTALKAQDYPTAYGYLDANAMSNGQVLTQNNFIQIARAADSMNGPVTSFRFIANASDPRQIITSVIRKQSIEYSSHMQIKQQNGTWKIVSIDII